MRRGNRRGKGVGVFDGNDSENRLLLKKKQMIDSQNALLEQKKIESFECAKGLAPEQKEAAKQIIMALVLESKENEMANHEVASQIEKLLEHGVEDQFDQLMGCALKQIKLLEMEMSFSFDDLPQTAFNHFEEQVHFVFAQLIRGVKQLEGDARINENDFMTLLNDIVPLVSFAASSAPKV